MKAASRTDLGTSLSEPEPLPTAAQEVKAVLEEQHYQNQITAV